MLAVAEADERAPRVLLVEDEEPILEGLTELFSAQGFEAEGAPDGHVALARLASTEYDLVLLDLMIPGVDGLTVLRRTRDRGVDTPVLILTAKGAEEDVVAGLEAGADDYVTKPFGIRELIARARGLLRRARPSVETPRRLGVGRVIIDFDLLEITWDGGRVGLTAREGLLLEHLTARAQRPVSREELLVDVWGYNDGTVRTRTVDVHVQQLRAKLRGVPGGEAWIATVRGRGYRFAGEP
jgi:two-component system response regulator RegX3